MPLGKHPERNYPEDASWESSKKLPIRRLNKSDRTSITCWLTFNPI